jgi:hypothetical protein
MSAEMNKLAFSATRALMLTLPLIACASSRADVSPVTSLQELRRDFPDVQWQTRQTRVLDLRGVGRQDRVYLGYQGSDGVLAIYLDGGPGQSPRRLMRPFGISPSVADGVCAKPVKLEVMPASCERDEGPIAGCTPNPRAKEIVVIGGDCDTLSVFWNPNTKSLDWWRL